MRTAENALQYEHSLDHLVEFFSKAGSMRDSKGKRAFYESSKDSILRLFQSAWIVDNVNTMKLLLWVRDCRGGAGNRSGFRHCLEWLATRYPQWIQSNIEQIPEVGRWDDLRVLFNTPLKTDAAAMWAAAIYENDGLAAKWAKRTDKAIQSHFDMKIADFRRYLAKQRKLNSKIVETQMCNGSWREINYPHIPSLAMARYNNAFTNKDGERFQTFKNKVETGEAKINAGVLFPHDCVLTSMFGDRQTADLQFEALPNFIKTDEKIITICDTSGSMNTSIGGSNNLRAVHISQALSLYCSDRIGKGNPFYRKFIGFCSESSFKDWANMGFSQAVGNSRIFDGAIGGTRIDRALDLILSTAQFFGLSQEFMPTMLLILSDMQFHSSSRWSCGVVSNQTEVERSMNRWREAGYQVPKIVYWNLVGYTGSPATVEDKNVGLVSGFSPSILSAVLACEDFTPRGIMYKALERYHVNIPG